MVLFSIELSSVVALVTDLVTHCCLLVNGERTALHGGSFRHAAREAAAG